MENTNIIVLLLRFLHIFAGIAWAGAGFLALTVISPYIAKMQGQGGSALSGFYGNSRWSAFMGAAGGITVLAGLILYFGRPWFGWTTMVFSQAGTTVLTIGAVAGVLALIHGGASLSRKQRQFSEFAASITGAPTTEQSARIASLTQDLKLHTTISLVLVLISVIGMATARHIY